MYCFFLYFSTCTGSMWVFSEQTIYYDKTNTYSYNTYIKSTQIVSIDICFVVNITNIVIQIVAVNIYLARMPQEYFLSDIPLFILVQCTYSQPKKLPSKTVFSTVKYPIDAGNCSNTIRLFLNFRYSVCK